MNFSKTKISIIGFCSFAFFTTMSAQHKITVSTGKLTTNELGFKLVAISFAYMDAPKVLDYSNSFFNVTYTNRINKRFGLGITIGYDETKSTEQFDYLNKTVVKYLNALTLAIESNFFYTKNRNQKFQCYSGFGLGLSNIKANVTMDEDGFIKGNTLGYNISLINGEYRFYKNWSIELGLNFGYKGLINVGISKNF